MKFVPVSNSIFQRIFVMMMMIAGITLMKAQEPTPENERLPLIRERVIPTLRTLASTKGVKVGNPVFIRIFKESSELELWMQPSKTGKWVLVKTYPIATYGGQGVGPKLIEGDSRAPEGFYTVEAKQLNPASNYHLAFNVGYPNAYDASLGRTGSLIMVHGNEVSIGCFAMTDPGIEEIYLFAEAALKNGQAKFSIHSFPFRMTAERLAKESANPALTFWKELLPGYTWFEEKRTVPEIVVDKSGYHLKP